MSGTENKYRLLIRPGILKDGTYGVYAIPETNASIEYQLDAQFASVNEAREMAEKYLNFGGPQVVVIATRDNEGDWIKEDPTFSNRYFVTDQISIETEREVDLRSVVTDRTEEKHEAALKASLKKMLQMPTSFKLAPFAKITESTPYLLSIVCLVVFVFSLSLTVPKEIPVVGDIIGGKTLGPSEIARLFPFVLLFFTILLQWKVRRKGLANSATRDNVLSLALKHGWRRERFASVMLDTMESEDLGWLRKLGEWLQSWDPDTFRQVRAEANTRPAAPNDSQEAIDGGRLLDEDFEARIHALYYMDKETVYGDSSVMVHPFLFVIGHRRAVRRARAFVRSGLGGLLYLGVCSLPGGDEYKLRTKLFRIIVAWPILMFGVPLVWAFFLRPWPTVFGFIGMTLFVGAILVPLILWNYKLMTLSRGLPRGMSWEDIQGDMKFIQAL